MTKSMRKMQKRIRKAFRKRFPGTIVQITDMKMESEAWPYPHTDIELRVNLQWPEDQSIDQIEIPALILSLLGVDSKGKRS